MSMEGARCLGLPAEEDLQELEDMRVLMKYYMAQSAFTTHSPYVS